jgi:Spy/CpxP family protein refolding chaperone
MNKLTKISAITVIAATTLFAGTQASARWGDPSANCMRGAGPDSTMQMPQRGKRQKPPMRDLDLTAEQAKTLVAARLIMHGNVRLKAGQVTTNDEENYLVDIVTIDNSLVSQVEVDRNKGLPRGPFRGAM